MGELERLRKRAERLREINVKLKTEILRLGQESRERETEIERLEMEIKSLVEIVEPGGWK